MLIWNTIKIIESEMSKYLRTNSTDDINNYLSYYQSNTNCCNLTLDV